ncbi:MAG TPA: membrane protein insertase YidC [Elusimicrobiota bacterium]|nr:membrane protein insertase YidC [Elusimicrobiota bacterium]
MQKNIAVALLLSFGVLILWDKFILQPQRQVMTRQTASVEKDASLSQSSSAAPSAPAPQTGPASYPSTVRKSVESKKEEILFESAKNRVRFDPVGASIDQWELEDKGRFVAIAAQVPGLPRPLETFPDMEFQLVKKDPNGVVFEGRRPDGLVVTKKFVIDGSGSFHAVELTLKNTGSDPLDVSWAMGWSPGLENGMGKDERTERVLVCDSPKLIQLKPGKQKPKEYDGPSKWWALDSQYYIVAFIEEGQNVHIISNKHGKRIEAIKTTYVKLPPGSAEVFRSRLFIGPKGYADLKKLGLDLERSVDFGFFGPIGLFLLKLLYAFHRVTHNYGWAIILLTVCIQVLTFPLTLRSLKHGIQMRELQPQMKKLQEMYKGDPKRMNVEVMHLYKKHGMKFMGMEGCFPVLLQIPIFFALYTTLRNAHELCGAPWIGWIRDLSIHDPYFVLPILMGIGMFLQQKMSGAALDPAQAKMMAFFPIILTFSFLKLPSGLVLYWVTSSVCTITTQTVLMKKLGHHLPPVVEAGQKGGTSRA